MLAVEEILAANVQRKSAKNGPPHARAEASDAAVLQPEVAQLLANQLRVGLRGIRECARERYAIVIDPVPRPRRRYRAGPPAAHPRSRHATCPRRHLEHPVADTQIADVTRGHLLYPAIDRGERSAQRQGGE